MRDLSGLREHCENVARSLFVLTPPESLLGDLQRALRVCYRCVNIAEHVSGYLNKSFNDGFGTVLQFANSGPREFFDAPTARRYRDIRKVFCYKFFLTNSEKQKDIFVSFLHKLLYALF